MSISIQTPCTDTLSFQYVPWNSVSKEKKVLHYKKNLAFFDLTLTNYLFSLLHDLMIQLQQTLNRQKLTCYHLLIKSKAKKLNCNKRLHVISAVKPTQTYLLLSLLITYSHGLKLESFTSLVGSSAY